MARIQIPIDALTSRLGLQDRFNSMRSGGLSGRFANLRPVSEFFDMKRLSKPANFGEVQSRWNYNLSYFSSNYSVVFLMLSIYALLTNWVLLFDIIFVIAGMFLIGKLDGRDLEIGSFKATTSQLWTGLLVISVPLGLRGRRNEGAAQQPSWEDGRRVVEELETEVDDSDTQGVGLVSRGQRFASDPLRFTGTDLGDRVAALRRGHNYQHSDDDEDEDEDDSEDDTDEDSSDEEEDDVDWEQLSPRERDDVLAQRALARVRRAQERGKLEVNLSKDEMAALDRRRKRLEKEARKQERRQRREREQRFAIPLSQFEPPTRRREPPMAAEDDLPRHPSPGTFAEVQTRDAMPPMGYFPPPNASRARPRSATSASQRPTPRIVGERGSSPFNYAYVQGGAAQRHPSDSANSRRGPLPSEEGWGPAPNMSPASSTSSMSKSQSNVDPFQFQVEGPRVAASRRNVSGSTDGQRTSVAPPVGRGSRTSRGPPPEEDSSEESSEESTSDDTGSGAQIAQPPPLPPPPQPPMTRRGRKEAVAVEEAVTRESAREVSRGKKSANPSPSKRKPASSRRKKK
ncbi:Prenylated Rab acceptor 1 [Colletotrichum higginsianum IMI 349063]|uniref:Prenylated Rab acceptor 1 n=1 Tax=Colletotrichum higginsianum (strain IMI 349063) TaxID=759273 RepID=A0A1B7XY03_COLHI|nr:Prenylated Rab acceptor 1 [Colletotrichum higginsianum IMI 349063]OBR04635.1 Prenylated Rab acceptor 1 [Colletotrichum higginsianum IMI 349063]